MSTSAIRSTLAGIMMAATAAAGAQAQESAKVEPDQIAMMTGICTANATVLQTLGDNADKGLREAYQAENASYAEQIRKAGFKTSAEACLTL